MKKTPVIINLQSLIGEININANSEASKKQQESPIIQTIREMLDMDIPVTDRLIAIDRFMLQHKLDGARQAVDIANKRFSELSGE